MSSLELARTNPTGNLEKAFQLASLVIDRHDFDALLAQAVVNQEQGTDVMTVLSKGDQGGMSFSATSVLNPTEGALPALSGRFATAYRLGPERDEPLGAIGVSSRGAILSAQPATHGLRRFLREDPSRVKITIWGFPDETPVYREIDEQ